MKRFRELRRADEQKRIRFTTSLIYEFERRVLGFKKLQGSGMALHWNSFSVEERIAFLIAAALFQAVRKPYLQFCHCVEVRLA